MSSRIEDYDTRLRLSYNSWAKALPLCAYTAEEPYIENIFHAKTLVVFGRGRQIGFHWHLQREMSRMRKLQHKGRSTGFLGDPAHCSDRRVSFKINHYTKCDIWLEDFYILDTAGNAVSIALVAKFSLCLTFGRDLKPDTSPMPNPAIPLIYSAEARPSNAKRGRASFSASGLRSLALCSRTDFTPWSIYTISRMLNGSRSLLRAFSNLLFELQTGTAMTSPVLNTTTSARKLL